MAQQRLCGLSGLGGRLFVLMDVARLDILLL
jgi:hypothetical protein